MSHSGPIVPADPQPTADVDPQAGRPPAQAGGKAPMSWAIEAGRSGRRVLAAIEARS